METEAESSDSVLHDLSSRRIILPRVPKDLHDQNVGNDIFWHNNEAKILEKKLGAANGLFIRHEMCMFIPAPSFHKIFLLKELKIGKKGYSGVTEQTIRDIGEVALHHLRKIDGLFEKLSDGSDSVEQVKVDFVVYVIRKENETDQNRGGEDTFLNKWQAVFDNFFEGKNFKNITYSCVFIHESKVSEELVDGRKALTPEGKELKTLAEKMLEPEIFGWEQSDELFRVSGDEGLTFSDSEKVGKKFTELFGSNWVHFLPDIDHLSANLLSHVDEKGKVKDSDQHFSYTGELQLFYHEFVAHMKQQVPGIFIKDFQPHHIRSLFSWPYLRSYQIDWLFLGTDRIVVFEIGMLKNPENIKDALNKKLKQVSENLMPFFKLIVRAVDMSYNTDDRINPKSSRWEDFWDFVKTKVTFVILFPNAQSSAIKNYLNSRSKSKSEKNLYSEVLVVCPEREPRDPTKFLVCNARGKPELKQVTVEEILTKRVCEMTTSTSNEDREPSKFENRLSLITNLLTLSFLTVVDDPFRPLDVDERYGIDYSKEFSDSQLLVPSAKVNGQNLILSREQHRILQEDKKFLIIQGEAGSGKTALLLMKALRLASDSNIGKVLYIIPEHKEELNKYLELFRRENEEILNKKFEICRYRQNLEHPVEAMYDQIGSKIWEINTSVALLIDEFYYNSPSPFLLYPAACCWVSYVTHANKLELISREQIDNFIELAVDGMECEMPVGEYSKFCTSYVDSLFKTPLVEFDAVCSFTSESSRIIKDQMRKQFDWDRDVIQVILEDVGSKRGLKTFIQHNAEWAKNRHLFWNIYLEVGLKLQIEKKFTYEYLHVLLRSSYHISKFAHDFIHRTKTVDASTALTVGTFVSSQSRIEVFRHDCNKATPSELFEAYFPKLSEKHEPLIIVIASSLRMQMWNSFEVSERKCSISIVNLDRDPTENLNVMQFTGAEYASVLLIVDLTKESKQLEQAFYAAVTRACYELVIVVDESLVELDRKIREVNETLLFYHSLLNGDALPSKKAGYWKLYNVLRRTKDVQPVLLAESVRKSTGFVKSYLLLVVPEKTITQYSINRNISHTGKP